MANVAVYAVRAIKIAAGVYLGTQLARHLRRTENIERMLKEDRATVVDANSANPFIS